MRELCPNCLKEGSAAAADIAAGAFSSAPRLGDDDAVCNDGIQSRLGYRVWSEFALFFRKEDLNRWT